MDFPHILYILTVTAREVEKGCERGGRGEWGPKFAIAVCIKFFFSLVKQHTLNKATIHAVVNLDLR